MKRINKKENTLIILELESYSLEIIKRGVHLSNLLNGFCYIIFYAKKIDKLNINLIYALLESKKACGFLKVNEFSVKYYSHEKEIIEDVKGRIKSLVITQIILARDIESRLDEIIYDAYSNLLLKNIPKSDFHFVSSTTDVTTINWGFNSGIAGFLYKNFMGQNIVYFSRIYRDTVEGIFLKAGSTNLNNGLFIQSEQEELIYFDVTDNVATKSALQLKDYLSQENSLMY